MRKIGVLIFIVILVVFAVAFYWFLNSISKTKTPPTQEEFTTLDYKKLEKLEGLKLLSEPVKVEQPRAGVSFGRENPFAPY